MSSKLFIGCSGWNYLDTSQNGGWVNAFYPSKKTKTFAYYSQFFDTVEMIQTFYKKHYKKMSKDLFTWLTEISPENFKMSVKVPQIITDNKRLNIYNKTMIDDLTLFLGKISPLKNANKLGAIIIRLPPYFTIKEHMQLQEFLYMIKNNSVTKSFDYAIEFNDKSWDTKGVLNILQHYDVSYVLSDAPSQANLNFLNNEDHITCKSLAVFRLCGRNTYDHMSNYSYSQKELETLAEKIKKINDMTDNTFVYFSNSYGGQAAVNALQFKEMVNNAPLFENKKMVLDRTRKYLSNSL
ncbi:DUF72 domain-containing protein [Candidatus Nitrosocosmicus sp. R]